ncbi:MAG TPA: hypothetical protein VKB78_03195, partial [Pirellulales bacterium]|nr:hypothetical protein [Pirellulales bacterium]
MKSGSRQSVSSSTVVFAAFFFVAGLADGQTLSWGVNGAGGSGNWDTTTADWFNGSQNVTWPSGGNAIFGGAAGGTVNSFTFGPVVSSITFNTPGYVIQNGYLQSGTNGLTVTTNVDATIGSNLENSASAGNFLVKNGPAALVLSGGTNFLGAAQVSQGELQLAGSSNLFFSSVTLADAPGVTVTLAQSSSITDMMSLAGGGTSGGIVQPNNQARTVTLDIFRGGNFGGVLQDNGSGILAVDLFGTNSTETLTNVNTYSGSTSVSGNLVLTGNGSAPNSSVSVFPFSSLVLDDTGVVVANRISDSKAVGLNGGSLQLKGNSATPVEEVLGSLTVTGVGNVTVMQPGSAAAELTFAGLQRNGHATLNVVGPGIRFVGLSNGANGIVPVYVTLGNEWATVGGDGRFAPYSAYAGDLNSGSTSDHVKLTSSGTTLLAAPTTRASLNMQNSDATVGQVLDLAGKSLALTSGGLLSSGAGSGDIRNG